MTLVNVKLNVKSVNLFQDGILRTAASAVALSPLRQTARYLLGFHLYFISFYLHLSFKYLVYSPTTRSPPKSLDSL